MIPAPRTHPAPSASDLTLVAIASAGRRYAQKYRGSVRRLLADGALRLNVHTVPMAEVRKVLRRTDQSTPGGAAICHCGEPADIYIASELSPVQWAEVAVHEVGHIYAFRMYGDTSEAAAGAFLRGWLSVEDDAMDARE